MNVLVLEEIRKSFAAVHAVQGISASVPAGCIYGFLGPNGAGKTTTIRMIMNIISPDSGRIEILGSPSTQRARHPIGYMPEERGLYRKMKVDALLQYIGAIKGMKRAEIPKAVDRWIHEIGLAGWEGRRLEDLSRGMQQKIQFIATVIDDRELVILDEPFSGLDPINVDLITDILCRMRTQGKTVIFSTHIMEQAEKLCDYILLINKGKKIIDGTLDQVRAACQTEPIVTIEMEEDASFLSDLDMVRSVTPNGRRLDVALNSLSSAQEFLLLVASRTSVHHFEIKMPSLHEIFVRLVGDNNA